MRKEGMSDHSRIIGVARAVLRPADALTRAELRRQQAVIGRRMGPLTLGVSILGASILVVEHWGEVLQNLLACWLALISLPLIVLIFVWWREGFDAPAHLHRRILRRVPVTAAVEGIAWAAAPFLFFDPSSLNEQLLLSLVIFALTAAASGMLRGLFGSALLFMTPPLVSLAIRFATSGIAYGPAIALSVVIFGALIVISSYLGHRQLITTTAAQVAAREALSTLEEALESTNDAFGVFDSHDVHPIFLNQPYRALFGGEPDGLAPGEELVQQLGGRWLRSSVRRTHGGRLVHVHTDITTLKQTEDALREARDAAEAASRAKSRFLATMSHELRTPLNAIIGFAELIGLAARKEEREKDAEYATTIAKAGRHLLSLINDILDLSKIEAGSYELVKEDLDLAGIVREVGEMLESEIVSAGLRFELDLPDPCPLRGDERALRQIFINLIGNAIKFTPSGGRIRVTARRVGEHWRVLVMDDGEGIASEDLERVLEPFVQGEDAINRRHGGTGLGLPLVRRLIAMHGGEFQLHSERGQGTTAEILLPLVHGNAETKSEEGNAATASRSSDALPDAGQWRRLA